MIWKITIYTFFSFWVIMVFAFHFYFRYKRRFVEEKHSISKDEFTKSYLNHKILDDDEYGRDIREIKRIGNRQFITIILFLTGIIGAMIGKLKVL